MPADPPVITLTTDFGLTDEYVGVMKGVVACHAPQARVIDLCHAVPPQDIRHAAHLLHAAWRYFPSSAIHVVVVDPGVGTARRIILLNTEHGRFLAPDNGVLTLLLDQPDTRVQAVANPAFFLSPASATFHGRDRFAPVAAALASGAAPDSLGPAVDPTTLVRLPMPEPRIDATTGTLAGEVVTIDHFGNLITNLSRTHLAALPAQATPLLVYLENQPVGTIRTAYGDAAPGEALALFGSRNTLEIAINQGHAARTLGASSGSRVRLAPDQQEK